MADSLNDPIYESGKCRTVKVWLTDDSKNPQAWIDLAVTVLEHLIAAGEVVLIHCQAGQSRSPHILALYLSKAENKPYDEIYAEIQRLRPEVKRSKLNSNFTTIVDAAKIVAKPT